MRKTFISFFIILLVCSGAIALSDPEPNPFDINELENDEQVFEGTVNSVEDEILTILNSNSDEFSGRFDQILKYRDGGGPAATNEFFVGDNVRALVDENDVVRAVQNKELFLCEQNFYGWVRNPSDNEFILETVEEEEFTINFGQTTQFRDETGELLFGYSPRGGDVVRVHGVLNSNVQIIFTETFGAYMSLLNEDALVPFLITQNEDKEENVVITEGSYDDEEESGSEKVNDIEELSEVKMSFTDVLLDEDFFTAIRFMKDEEIVNGYADGSFKPKNKINRAEFIQILIMARFADELIPVSKSCFSDFEKGAWFAPAVCLAKEKGIIRGYDDGTFCPDGELNLAEAVTILVKTFGFVVRLTTENEEWYVPFFERAEKIKIYPSQFGKPNDLLVRGQMSELVMRAVRYLRGDLVDYLDSV